MTTEPVPAEATMHGPPLDHGCWCKRLAEGLAATLAEFDNDSSDSALRQILRREIARRRAAEAQVVKLDAAAPAIRAEAAAAERERIREAVAEIRSRYRLGRPAILTRAGQIALIDEIADLLGGDTP